MKPSVAIRFVAYDLEGPELVFDPEATFLGITQSEYDRFRRLQNKPQQSVAKMTEAEAFSIYDVDYWRVMKCSQMPDGVDLALFQMGVNIGTTRAIKILQSTVGVSPDGRIGPVTLAAVKAQDPAKLTEKLLAAQDAYYDSITRANPTRNGAYINGWHNRVDKVRLFIKSGFTEAGVASLGLVAFLALLALLLWVIR